MRSRGTVSSLSTDAFTIAAALRLASGCLRDARLLAGAGSRNAAYLAEQALEQCIRAVATSEAIHIQRSDAHQLEKVVRSLPLENPLVGTLHQLTWLEAYATAFRYPTATGRVPPAPDMAKILGALAGIESLLLRLAGHFGVDLERDDRPAATTVAVR